MNPIHSEIVVLGAGPGGYAAAFYAADLGKKVILVDREKRLGGVCLNRGCITSKPRCTLPIPSRPPGNQNTAALFLKRRVLTLRSCEAGKSRSWRSSPAASRNWPKCAACRC